MRQFLLFIVIICLASYVGAEVKKWKEEKVYIYKWQSTVSDYSRAMDTLDKLFLPIVGKSLSVDQSEAYKSLLINQIKRVWGRPVLDSIIVKSIEP